MSKIFEVDSYLSLSKIPEHITDAVQTVCDFFDKKGMREWAYRGLADRRLVNILERQLEELANKPSGTEARVCDDIAKRQQLGIQKYSTTVESNPLSLKQWLQHAYEECLDQAVYLKRAIEELEKSS
jgi:hypothetical protein